MWDNATKTKAGLLLDQKLLASGGGIKIKKAVVSDATSLDTNSITDWTDITVNAHAAKLGEPYLSNDKTETIFPVSLYNTELGESYRAKAVGLFAADGDGEVLYLVSYDKTGNLVPSEEESPGFTIDWFFHLKNDLAESVTVEVTDAGKLTMEQADARYGKLVDVEQLQEDTTLWYVDVTLKQNGWIGSEAPFTQTVESLTINEQDVWLVKALDKDADVATVKAYNKAFSIITQGTAETHLGNVSFKVLKKPATDITVRLLMRGADADEAVPDPENAELDASDLKVYDTHELISGGEQNLQDMMDEIADRVLTRLVEKSAYDAKVKELTAAIAKKPIVKSEGMGKGTSVGAGASADVSSTTYAVPEGYHLLTFHIKYTGAAGLFFSNVWQKEDGQFCCTIYNPTGQAIKVDLAYGVIIEWIFVPN